MTSLHHYAIERFFVAMTTDVFTVGTSFQEAS